MAVLFMLSAISVILFSACSQNSDMIEDTVRVGVLVPLSGPYAVAGEDIISGVKEGFGDSVDIITEDTKCLPTDALTAYKKLNDVDGVDLFIGPACGSPQEVVAKASEEKDVILLPSAASEELFSSGNYNIFQTQYSLEKESRFMAEKISGLGYEDVVLVSYANAFSESHVKSFKENYKGKILDEFVLPENDADLNPVVSKIKELNPSAVYSPDSALATKSLRLLDTKEKYSQLMLLDFHSLMGLLTMFHFHILRMFQEMKTYQRSWEGKAPR